MLLTSRKDVSSIQDRLKTTFRENKITPTLDLQSLGLSELPAFSIISNQILLRDCPRNSSDARDEKMTVGWAFVPVNCRQKNRGSESPRMNSSTSSSKSFKTSATAADDESGQLDREEKNSDVVETDSFVLKFGFCSKESWDAYSMSVNGNPSRVNHKEISFHTTKKIKRWMLKQKHIQILNQRSVSLSAVR